MNLNNFTIKAQEAIQQAFQIASAYNQQAIEPANLLKGVMEVEETIVQYLFSKCGIRNVDPVVEKMVASFPKVTGGEPYLSRTASEVLQKAVSLSR